ncbi:hypothetical protein H0E87_006798 [Populus deltoides]|uniref:Protein RFT1 homolog n=1 Tax=Populus deltoides TaxID=3696 RepID=A0A8T2Z8J4_POPDE|nr:hypothetical protein H0E87_006798 [Populus deltoides]KAH8513666.1 hypothetical protein H0E87_006798 [Populus deltoides]
MVGYPIQPGFIWTCSQLRVFSCEIGVSSTPGKFTCYIFQDSSAFSFTICLPSGWTVLLFSGVITLISEKLFLDHKNFWPAFKIHFAIGLSCFCIASFIITKNTRARELS